MNLLSNMVVGAFLTVVAGNTTGALAQSGDLYDDSLTCIVQTSRTLQLPVEPLENKIREGRAKKRSAVEIYSVVLNRKKLLLQIRDDNRGTFPLGYMQQLFDLERSDVQRATMSRNHGGVSASELSMQHKNLPTVSSTKKQKLTDTSAPGKRNSVQPEVDKRAKGNPQKLRQHEQKVEKTMDKAAARVDRRIKVIEKRLQKREMKRRGSEK